MISDRTKAYYDLKKRNDVRESAKRLRRQFLRYKDAEIVYSITHKKLLELAGKAGAIYRITNEFIRGNLHLTKFDKDYPENKLSGAVFEVYRDTNGNKELDKEDELLGVMEETEPGQYEMKDLLYGGVLIREKTAPDGFYLDENTYYIMIDKVVFL